MHDFVMGVTYLFYEFNLSCNMVSEPTHGTYQPFWNLISIFCKPDYNRQNFVPWLGQGVLWDPFGFVRLNWDYSDYDNICYYSLGNW